MIDYIEATLPTGATVKVEIEPRTGAVQAGRIEEKLMEGSVVLEDALVTIRSMVESVVQSVNELSVFPNKIEVKFGIKVDIEAGAVIAKATTGAHYGVKLVWDFPSIDTK